MRSSIVTGIELGDAQRWLAVLALVATLALEVLDAAHGWGSARPPITADDCLDVCALSGVGVQRWTYDECACQGAEDEPVDTGG